MLKDEHIEQFILAKERRNDKFCYVMIIILAVAELVLLGGHFIYGRT